MRLAVVEEDAVRVVPAGMALAEVVGDVRWVERPKVRSHCHYGPTILLRTRCIRLAARTVSARQSTKLGYQDSNLEWLNQNQLCCQLHHTPLAA
jgi:hypothetical protein